MSSRLDLRTITKIDLPKNRREATIIPGSVDKENRTVDVTWGKGAQVMRSNFWGDRWMESLSMDPAAVRMGRLQSGSAPVLDTHNSDSVRDMLGVVQRASLDAGAGRATLRFSKRADVDPVWQDIQDGIIQNVSIGYQTYKYRDATPPGQELSVFEATDWEPMEISTVPVGADPDAGMRSASVQTIPCEIIRQAPSAEGEHMGLRTQPAAPAADPKNPPTADPAPGTRAADPNPPAADPAAPAAPAGAAPASDRSAAEILKACRKAGLGIDFAEELVGKGLSVDEARAAIIDKLAALSTTRGISPVVAVVDGGERDQARAAAIENCLMHRSAPAANKLTDGGRDFRGMTLLEIGRELLEARGIRTRGMNRDQLAGEILLSQVGMLGGKRAMESVGDLPAILANVANKTLRASYEAYPQTFRLWCKEGKASDFKPVNRTQVSDFPPMQKVGASGEIKMGAVSDGKETYSLVSYATKLAVNRQVIINDDLGALTRMPELAGRSCSDLESDTVYAVLSNNAAMGDSIALFHASHSNLAGSGNAVGITGMNLARKAMRLQTNLQKRPINLTPKYLIVAPDRETTAEQLVGPIVPQQTSNLNPFSGKLVSLVEPRILASGGQTPWYVAADPGQVDTIEFMYLEGQEGPFMESRLGFDIDGLELKVRLDFAAKAIDWRGLYKDPGA